jgi:DNA-binding NarL/FixJ family response regulator
MSISTPQALVIDDDQNWQQILRDILQDEGIQVTLAGTYAEALRCIQHGSYRLALVDLALSPTDHTNRDGLKLLNALNQHDPTCITILISGHATIDHAMQAMHAFGALTCMQKDTFRRADFVGWVQKALEMQPVRELLTNREQEVLELLVDGLSNKAIAEKLFVSPNTVKRHLKSIYEKLDVSTRAAAVAKAMGGN